MRQAWEYEICPDWIMSFMRVHPVLKSAIFVHLKHLIKWFIVLRHISLITAEVEGFFVLFKPLAINISFSALGFSVGLPAYVPMEVNFFTLFNYFNWLKIVTHWRSLFLKYFQNFRALTLLRKAFPNLRSNVCVYFVLWFWFVYFHS